MNRPVDLPLADIVRCANNAEFVAAVEELFAELDAEIAARNPVCTNRGACCSFGEFGHRLFVTPVELAYFLARVDGPIRPPESRDHCPYQSGGKCTVRTPRPAGCRIFYCDPNSQSWQGPATEQVLARIKDLHVRFDLPYAYADWTDSLTHLASQLTDRPTKP